MSFVEADAVAEITSLIMARPRLIHAKDVTALLAQSAPDVVTFDALPPLSWQGTEALREKIATWFGGYASPISVMIRDLQVTARDDIGFAHYLYQVTGTTTDGTDVAMWVRATVGLVKQHGSWHVTHEHTSVPFDAATGKAALDLEP
jgi:ketosteroid isomerase-like protein